MKLRILDNTVRLRLAQGEVTTLIGTGKISAQTDFKSNSLSYEILLSENEEDIVARFANQTITIAIPTAKANEWASGSEAGMSNDSSELLKVLIEKDFQCLHRRPGEDESDNFPNPLAESSK